MSGTYKKIVVAESIGQWSHCTDPCCHGN